MNNSAYRILTPRLLIRSWEPSDAINLAASVAENLEHLRPWMIWATEESTDADFQYNRLRKARAMFDKDEDYGYAIFSPDGRQIIGSTGLHTRLGDDALEIGYWIDKDHVNQGYATESSASLTRVAFEVLHVRRVEIHCDPRNQASAAVARKLGYTHEATLRQRTIIYGGQPSDSMIWSLLSAEYPASPSATLEIQVFDGCNRRIL